MQEETNFTQQEDQIIKDLYERCNLKKWSSIAKALAEKCGTHRGARQCKNRYEKHLDPLIGVGWTAEQQRNLYRYHDEIGNKWAIIAQKFPGRTDNHVKNHFYSKMRKAIRYLNKTIKRKYPKEFKQLKMPVIYKIIEALEDRFKQSTPATAELVSKCMSLKYGLLEYVDEIQKEKPEEIIFSKELINEISKFDKNYRKKTKRERRGSNQGSDILKLPSYEKRNKSVSDWENNNSQQQYSQILSNPEDSCDSQGKPLLIIVEDMQESNNSKNQTSLKAQKIQNKENQQIMLRGSGMSIQSANSIQQILKGKHILQFSQIPEPPALKSYFSHHSSNRDQSQKGDMFGDQLRLSGGLNHMMQIQEESGGDDYIFPCHR